jgi:predicted nucleotidyltransferase
MLFNWQWIFIIIRKTILPASYDDEDDGDDVKFLSLEQF